MSDIKKKIRFRNYLTDEAPEQMKILVNEMGVGRCDLLERCFYEFAGKIANEA